VRYGWEPGQVRIVNQPTPAGVVDAAPIPEELVLASRAWFATLAVHLALGDADAFAMPDDLADYWIHGEGAAKVRWCTEGAFERARRALREHVPAPMLDGTVANLYKRACGKWPGQDRD